MTEYPKTSYGPWTGHPKAFQFTPDRCSEEVYEGWVSHQCYRRPGHGDRALFCKQHAKRHPAKESTP